MTSIMMQKKGPMGLAIAHLHARLIDAAVRAFGVQCDPQLTYTAHAEFGDLQSNIALLLAKQLTPKPREIAAAIVAHLSADAITEQPTVAGPGFINFKLQNAFLLETLAKLHADKRLGIEKEQPRKVIIDMSSPNIAKEMHVGHLRSTIIGESLAQMLAYLGHDVVKINHVGDWGTQFGMLIAELKQKHPAALTQPDSLALGDIVAFYKQAKKHFDEDDAFQNADRQEVVKLQSGDADSLLAWKLLCDQSRKAFQKIYDDLKVHDLIEVGESFYNSALAGLVEDLLERGIAVENDGAACIFLDGYVNRDKQPLPLIVRKTDGGYNYATTDLAALKHRVQHEGANDLIYVVDAGQSEHLEMVAEAGRLAGWVPSEVQTVHVPFGLVLGPDGKKLKTRSGETVRLQDLLDDAVAHARKELVARLKEKGQTETDEWIDNTAKKIGIGAVKYNDLRLDRTTNYKFELSKLLSLQGNTAPFMMYSYTRVQGIIRGGGIDMAALPAQSELSLSEALEFDLAKHLLKFQGAVQTAVEELMPHRLCEYLFELSQRFNRFYKEHSVLNAPEPQRTSRLILCDLTARTLQLGLTLLGIELVDRM